MLRLHKEYRLVSYRQHQVRNIIAAKSIVSILVGGFSVPGLKAISMADKIDSDTSRHNQQGSQAESQKPSFSEYFISHGR